MDISELKGTVLQRFQELTEIFAEPEDETERMLADRVNAMPQDLDREPPMLMDDPQRDTMPQALGSLEGRSQGGNKVPPLRRPQIENRKGEKVLLRDSETGKAVIRDTDMREMASR